MATGKPAEIGSIEKMSKSKKNLVDPDDIIQHWGADCARWFMLSDSPPERDVIWTETGVAGAGRFIQRIWRLMGDIEVKAAAKDARRPADFGDGGAGAPPRRPQGAGRGRPQHRGAAVQCGRCATLRAVQCAHGGAGQAGAGLDWALREAIEHLVQMIGPMMPHLAEECWARLGYNTLLADQPWPQVRNGLAR